MAKRELQIVFDPAPGKQPRSVYEHAPPAYSPGERIHGRVVVRPPQASQGQEMHLDLRGTTHLSELSHTRIYLREGHRNGSECSYPFTIQCPDGPFSYRGGGFIEWSLSTWLGRAIGSKHVGVREIFRVVPPPGSRVIVSEGSTVFEPPDWRGELWTLAGLGALLGVLPHVVLLAVHTFLYEWIFAPFGLDELWRVLLLGNLAMLVVGVRRLRKIRAAAALSRVKGHVQEEAPGVIRADVEATTRHPLESVAAELVVWDRGVDSDGDSTLAVRKLARHELTMTSGTQAEGSVQFELPDPFEHGWWTTRTRHLETGWAVQLEIQVKGRSAYHHRIPFEVKPEAPEC